MEIKKGDLFECVADVVMPDGAVSYVKGKVYRSDVDGCITDEEGFTRHKWDNISCARSYFKSRNKSIAVMLTEGQWMGIVSLLEAAYEVAKKEHLEIMSSKGWYEFNGCSDKKYDGFVALAEKRMAVAESILKQIKKQLGVYGSR